MAIITATTAELPAKGPTYPCLRRSRKDGMVVLFTERHSGTILHLGSQDVAPGLPRVDVGYRSSALVPADNTDNWEKCSITLSSAD